MFAQQRKHVEADPTRIANNAKERGVAVDEMEKQRDVFSPRNQERPRPACYSYAQK